MSFKIIVDSCCDLTGTMLKDPCFVKVPLTIRVENSSFVDDASLDRSDLLWAMKQSEDAPSTACPAPQRNRSATSTCSTPAPPPLERC